MKQLVQVGNTHVGWSEAQIGRALEINRKSGVGARALSIQAAASACVEVVRAVKVSGVAPLESQRHPARQLRREPFDSVSPNRAIRQRDKVPRDFNRLRLGTTCVL